VRVADRSNFNVATMIAAAPVTVRPGGIRKMYWHPNADERQYYIKGRGRMAIASIAAALSMCWSSRRGSE
jgi:oxalate decarboxylase